MPALYGSPVSEWDGTYMIVHKQSLAAVASQLNRRFWHDRGGLRELANRYAPDVPHPLKWPADKKNNFVNIHLSAKEKRKLGVGNDVISIHALTALAYPQVPRSIKDKFTQASLNLRYPRRKSLAASLLANEARRQFDDWHKVIALYEKSAAAKEQLAILGEDDSMRMEAFHPALKRAPDNILIPSHLFDRIRSADKEPESRSASEIASLFEDLAKEIEFGKQEALWKRYEPQRQAEEFSAVLGRMAPPDELREVLMQRFSPGLVADYFDRPAEMLRAALARRGPRPG